MTSDYCDNCGHPYTPGDSLYCSKCGQRLPSQLEKQLNTLDGDVRRDYQALRFTASLLVLLGWLVIVASVFGSLVLYSSLNSENATVTIVPRNWDSPGTDVPLGDPDPALGSLARFIAVSVSAGGILGGVVLIAFGQLLHAIVDIRNDARITSRIARMIYVRLAAVTAINGEGGSETGAGQSS